MEYEEAKAKFLEGVQFTDNGSYGEAIRCFNEVYEGYNGARQKAKCAYNIGFCWSKEGNHQGAMGWYGEWLGMPEAEADLRPTVLEAFWQAWKGNEAELALFTDAE